MRIAQVSPLSESVPPQGYGGTERVVSYLTEELVERGHEVTLFASGDSVTRAALVPCSTRSLRLDADCKDPLAHHLLMIERVLERAGEFDLVHFHTDYLHFLVARRLAVAHLTTLHQRIDIADLQPLFSEFADIPLASISDAQRKPLPPSSFCRTVQHGLPLDLYPFRPEPEDYFAFLGRISRDKRLDRAIEIAQRLGVRLKVAAKLDLADRANREYYEQEIQPRLGDPLIEFVGEIAQEQKADFLGRARCLLFPIDWPEPFGLVMIESMACGTPVVAFRCGAVPEVIDDGVTGFCVDDLDAATTAAARAVEIDRRACRETFERRFSAERMATDYLELYAQLVERARRRRGGRHQILATSSLTLSNARSPL